MPITTIQIDALARKNIWTATSEKKQPISTETIVEMASDKGTLQKNRSTSDRSRKKLWRFVNHATR